MNLCVLEVVGFWMGLNRRFEGKLEELNDWDSKRKREKRKREKNERERKFHQLVETLQEEENSNFL